MSKYDSRSPHASHFAVRRSTLSYMLQSGLGSALASICAAGAIQGHYEQAVRMNVIEIGLNWYNHNRHIDIKRIRCGISSDATPYSVLCLMFFFQNLQGTASK